MNILTVKQVKQIHEVIEKHWHDLSADYNMPEATALSEYSYDWQAIADELNATLKRGTCKMEQMPECQFDDITCSECGVALWAFSMDKAGEGVIATPNYCPYCGCEVVNE